MPTSFLDLPREIRDQIYGYVLISPTGFVEPRLEVRTGRILYKHKTGWSSYNSGNNNNNNNNNSVSSNSHYGGAVSRKRKNVARVELSVKEPGVDGQNDGSQFSKTISLSLCRTCWQIWFETNGLFWKHNTLIFPTFHKTSKTPIGVPDTLKSMGQIPSRMLTSVSISMPPLSPDYNQLGKTLQALTSRARHGCLKNLELRWEKSSFALLERGFSQGYFDLDGKEGPWYECLLDTLAGMGTGVEKRVIRLPKMHDLNIGSVGLLGGASPEAVFEAAVAELHVRFGGVLMMGEVVVWRNHERVVLV